MGPETVRPVPGHYGCPAETEGEAAEDARHSLTGSENDLARVTSPLRDDVLWRSMHGRAIIVAYDDLGGTNARNSSRSRSTRVLCARKAVRNCSPWASAS